MRHASYTEQTQDELKQLFRAPLPLEILPGNAHATTVSFDDGWMDEWASGWCDITAAINCIATLTITDCAELQSALDWPRPSKTRRPPQQGGVLGANVSRAGACVARLLSVPPRIAAPHPAKTC